MAKPETTAQVLTEDGWRPAPNYWGRDEPRPVECDLCGWKGRRIKARSAPCPNCGNGKVQFR